MKQRSDAQLAIITDDIKQNQYGQVQGIATVMNTGMPYEQIVDLLDNILLQSNALFVMDSIYSSNAQKNACANGIGKWSLDYAAQDGYAVNGYWNYIEYTPIPFEWGTATIEVWGTATTQTWGS